MPHPDCPRCHGTGTERNGAYDHETGTYDTWDGPCTCDANQPPPVTFESLDWDAEAPF